MTQDRVPVNITIRDILKRINSEMKDGSPSNAKKMLSDAHKRFPKNAHLLKLKADMAETDRLWNETIKFRRQAIQHCPPNRFFFHHNLLTRTLLNKGEHQKCRTRIHRELSTWADKPRIRATAEAYAKVTGDFDLILPIWREMVFSEKADKHTAIKLARVEIKLASPENALKALRKALDDHPDDLYLSFNEVLAIYEKGDYQLAGELSKKITARIDCPDQIKESLAKILVAVGEESGLKPADKMHLNTVSELNDNGEEIIIHRVTSSNQVLLVFTGMAKKGGLSLRELHQFIAPSNTNIIYLRDNRLLAFTCGLESKGACLSETFKWLRSIFNEWSIGNVFCFGNSAGGFAAIRYGIELAAVRILVFSSPTSFTSEVTSKDGRGRIFMNRIQKLAPTEAIDLRDKIGRASCRERV